MGILSKVFRKNEEEATLPNPVTSGPECSVCGQPGAEKKWAGQYFHKSCLRKTRKTAKRMI